MILSVFLKTESHRFPPLKDTRGLNWSIILKDQLFEAFPILKDQPFALSSGVWVSPIHLKSACLVIKRRSQTSTWWSRRITRSIR